MRIWTTVALRLIAATFLLLQARAEVFRVSTTVQLENQLGKLVAGDEMIIAPGDYFRPIMIESFRHEASLCSSTAGTAENPIILRGEDPNNPPIIYGGSITAWSTFRLLDGAHHWKIYDIAFTRSNKGIIIDASNFVEIHRARVFGVGEEAIHIRSGSKNTLIDGCVIEDTGNTIAGFGEAIYVGSDRSVHNFYPPDVDFTTIRNCVIGPNIRGEPLDIREGTSETVIEGCVVNATGLSGQNFADSFIDLKGTRTYVRYNTFYRSGAAALTKGVAVIDRDVAKSSYEHVIHDNTFYLDQTNIVMVSGGTPDIIAFDNLRLPDGGPLFSGSVTTSCCPDWYSPPAEQPPTSSLPAVTSGQPSPGPTRATLPPTSPPTSLPPTVAPTSPPTSLPPTAPPTSLPPTMAPTPKQTSSPTPGPTFPPSVTRSMAPSVAATSSPTIMASAIPSVVESTTPSVSTGMPSITASMEPSLKASDSPSASPTTIAPTVIASSEPSATQSAAPSITPTTRPSKTLSMTPTVLASVAPTGAPSVAPTGFPSQAPSLPPWRTVSASSTPSVSTSISTSMPSASPSIGDSPSPSALPTDLASSFPSSSPTRTGPDCDDSDYGEFYVASLDEYQRCVWAADPKRFNYWFEVCNSVQGQTTCPELCGICTDGCEDTDSKFFVGEAQRNCLWLRLRPDLKKDLCFAGSVAELACPETCDVPECDGGSRFRDPIDIEDDTPVPVTSAPSTITASEVCDDDKFATFWVEDIAEFKECVWLMTRVNETNILCDPEHPSGAFDVCEETCGKCTDDCEDSDGIFLEGTDERTCTWLSLRPSLQEEFCVPGDSAYKLCGETCDVCDGEMTPAPVPAVAPTTPRPSSVFCDDSMLETFYVPDILEYQRCVWLAARPDYQAQLCQEEDPSNARQICPETCGVCSDDCYDSAFSTFEVQNATRDCLWLSLRPSLNSELCNQTEVASVCQETCNTCDESATTI